MKFKDWIKNKFRKTPAGPSPINEISFRVYSETRDPELACSSYCDRIGDHSRRLFGTITATMDIIDQHTCTMNFQRDNSFKAHDIVGIQSDIETRMGNLYTVTYEEH